VLLDNDWAGDPDGLIALVHHLLAPANTVVAITSSFLDPAHPGSIRGLQQLMHEHLTGARG
jgi:hypothetical protein